MLVTSVHELLALRRWGQRTRWESCNPEHHNWQKQPKAQVRFYPDHARRSAKLTTEWVLAAAISSFIWLLLQSNTIQRYTACDLHVLVYIHSCKWNHTPFSFHYNTVQISLMWHFRTDSSQGFQIISWKCLLSFRQHWNHIYWQYNSEKVFCCMLIFYDPEQIQNNFDYIFTTLDPNMQTSTGKTSQGMQQGSVEPQTRRPPTEVLLV